MGGWGESRSIEDVENVTKPHGAFATLAARADTENWKSDRGPFHRAKDLDRLYLDPKMAWNYRRPT